MKNLQTKLPQSYKISLMSMIFIAFICSIWLFSPVAVNGQQTLTELPGRIKTPSGDGIPGVTVTAILIGGNFSRETVTDNEGYYVFKNMPVGNYRIRTGGSGFREKIREIVLRVNQAISFDFILGSDVAGTTSRLEGIITDKDEKIIPNARIKLINKKTKSIKEVSTDEEGKYVIDELDAGKYEIEVEIEGYKKKTDDFKIKGGTVKTKNLELKKESN